MNLWAGRKLYQEPPYVLHSSFNYGVVFAAVYGTARRGCLLLFAARRMRQGGES